MEKKLRILYCFPAILDNIVNKISWQCRLFSTSQHLVAVDSNSNRQAKIMTKLFGNRIAGSKKRWYPSETSAPDIPILHSPIFSARQKQQSKATQRRISVLNHLFMTHITELMATGEISEGIIGKGLQISRVKVSPDFSCIYVYWSLSKDLTHFDEMEKELKRCSGILRHELSRLKLIGEVPRITFLRDKINENAARVENILRTLEIDDPQPSIDLADQVREDFNLNQPTNFDEFNEDGIPKMRHDVLGLDHHAIMTRIMTKMKKSKQAWDSFNQGLVQNNEVSPGDSKLEEVHRKLRELRSNPEEFEKFLAQKHSRKNTPERKKFRKSDQVLEIDSEAPYDEGLHNLEDEDYIDEDYFESKDSSNSK